MLVGYWFYTFQIVKPKCLATIDKFSQSITVSFFQTTESQYQEFTNQVGRLEGVSGTKDRSHLSGTDNRTVKAIIVFHKPVTNEQLLIQQIQELAEKIGSTTSVVESNKDNFTGLRTAIEKTQYNPLVIVGDLTMLLLKQTPTLLFAPPLHLFNYCAQGNF